MNTVVVTGAYGFLGRHTCRILAREGFRVVGLGHGSWHQNEWPLWGLSAWHEDDVTLDALTRCAVGSHALVHMAGGSSVQASFSNPFGNFERTVSTVATVLEFIRTVSPRTKLVYPSSAGVYGNTEQIPIPESTPTSPVSPYGAYKSLCEQLIRMYARHYSVAAFVIRFFSIYGSGLRKQLLWDACCKMASGNCSFMGTGRELRDWLHVEDATRLIRLAIEHASTECPIVNGGAGVGVSVREILEELAACFPGNIKPTFLGTQRIGDPIAFVADIKLSREWGWEPRRSLKEGLGEYFTWWQRDQLAGYAKAMRSYANAEFLRTATSGVS